MSNKKINIDKTCEHDHARCIEDAVLKAELVCKKNNLRFTKIRKKVLQLIWSNHKPIGAYEILDSLRAEEIKAEPPTVYRALSFLIDAHLVHRLDSLNAFVGCVDPEDAHQGQFFICQDCNNVSEFNDHEISDLVESKMKSNGFSVTHQIFEVTGHCNNCR
tara:strand:- start:174 stop:656 length:483 start_codon:yes stop_codon:yes gene_type:complete